MLLALVDGVQIEDQVFAAEPFGGLARVEQFDPGDRWLVAAHDVDQVRQMSIYQISVIIVFPMHAF